MLKIKGLSKTYSKSACKALDNLDLEVRPGEIFGFIGPNGAGKTTLIKCICGIIPFEKGDIEVAGVSIRSNPLAVKSNIGYVSDSHIVYDKLTGREYVNFLADVYGVDTEIRKERIDKMLELFKMKDNYGQQINTYSHGMKQKISIMGALIHDPRLWVLDEPMTGLDPASSYELKQLMRSHCANGNTVFFSTHVLEVAEKLCDRIAIISGGKIILCGTMDEIKSRQKDESLEEIFMSVTGEAQPEQKAHEVIVSSEQKAGEVIVSSEEDKDEKENL